MRTRLPAPPISGGFGFPLGFGTVCVVTLAAVAGGATTYPLSSLLALTCTCALLATLTTFPAALATAAFAWALHSSFVLGRHGTLTFTPTSAHAALALAAAVLLASTLSTTIRRTTAHNPQ